MDMTEKTRYTISSTSANDVAMVLWINFELNKSHMRHLNTSFTADTFLSAKPTLTKHQLKTASKLIVI